MQRKNSHLDGVLHEKLVELLDPLAGPEKPEGNLVRQGKKILSLKASWPCEESLEEDKKESQAKDEVREVKDGHWQLEEDFVEKYFRTGAV